MTVISPVDSPLTKQRFESLYSQWEYDTRFVSSSVMITEHPAYQEIVKGGDAAVVFILQRLQRSGPNILAWALFDITGNNPVRHQDRGKLGKITKAWIQWGIKKGLI